MFYFDKHKIFSGDNKCRIYYRSENYLSKISWKNIFKKLKKSLGL